MSLITLLLVSPAVVSASASASSENGSSSKKNESQNTSSDGKRVPFTVPSDALPRNEHYDWQSYSRTTEFIPAEGMDEQSLKRFMRGLEQGDEEEEQYSNKLADDDVYRVQPFVAGMQEYDEYQQAWRYLGFMIDCNAYVYDDDKYDNGNRDLSNDGDTGEGCARFVLWAAYVDLEYEGNGISEYQFWNRFKNKWDTTTCSGNGGDQRCAQMDCHLENTHFSLLGFFKHRYYDDWMEQLFKHEGKCVWSSKEYSFMKAARETWPQGCTVSSYYTEEGSLIYYDLKPASSGSMVVGLYSDEKCVIEYVPNKKNDYITPEMVVGNFLLDGDASGSGDDDKYDFSGLSYDEALEYWDSGLSAFKFCQPCVAYDLNNPDGSLYTDDYYGNGNNGGGSGDPYECYDDADYTNVNQCMKFMAKTEMNTATFRDLTLAKTQRTLVDTPLAGYKQDRRSFYRKQGFGTILTYIFFVFSMLFLVHAVRRFMTVKKEVNYEPKFDLRQPLAGFT